MAKEEIQTGGAPAAIGPYAQGIGTGEFLFVSGQIPADPATGELPAGATAQAHRALENLGAVLKAGGSSPAQVVKTTVFLADLGDFTAVNAVYEMFFTKPFPARSCVAAAALPKGALLEIEAIAVRGA